MSRAISTAIIAITTSSSISVKAGRERCRRFMGELLGVIRLASVGTGDSFGRANKRHGHTISAEPAMRGGLWGKEGWSRQAGRPPGVVLPATSLCDKTRVDRNDRSASVSVWIKRTIRKKINAHIICREIRECKGKKQRGFVPASHAPPAQKKGREG